MSVPPLPPTIVAPPPLTTPVSAPLDSTIVESSNVAAGFTGNLSAGNLVATGTVTVRITGPGLLRPLVLSASINAAGNYVIPFPAAAIEVATTRYGATGHTGVARFTVASSYPGDASFPAGRDLDRFVVDYRPVQRLSRRSSTRLGKPVTLSVFVRDNLGKLLAPPELTLRTVVLIGPDGHHYGPRQITKLAPHGLFVGNGRDSSFSITLDTIGLKKGRFIVGYRISGSTRLHTLSFHVV